MAKGYSLDALVKEHYIKDTVGLGNSNINDKWGDDNAGTFPQNLHVNATVANGYPAGASAGNLEVLLTSAGTLGNCIQRYTDFNGSRMWIRSQKEGNGVRSWTPWIELINANNIYKAIYPIGIVLQFDNATNPNNLFTGTVWEQITDGRSARAATGPEAGTADGQIGSVAGSDSVYIAVDNLPRHTHDLREHTHSIASHTHSMAHTHTINHDHGAVNTSTAGWHDHSLSGTANAAGEHSHSISQGDNANVPNGRVASSNSGQTHVGWTNGAGNHTHSISGTANANGNHTHTVDLPNFAGTSGGSSSANTGGTALTTGSPNNNVSNVTGGDKNLDVRNSSHYYAFWKRVA